MLLYRPQTRAFNTSSALLPAGSMPDATTGSTIESVLQEQRLFAPPEALAASARIGSLEAYQALCSQAEAYPNGFWGDLARSELHWF